MKKLIICMIFCLLISGDIYSEQSIKNNSSKWVTIDTNYFKQKNCVNYLDNVLMPTIECNFIVDGFNIDSFKFNKIEFNQYVALDNSSIMNLEIMNCSFNKDFLIQDCYFNHNFKSHTDSLIVYNSIFKARFAYVNNTYKTLPLLYLNNCSFNESFHITENNLLSLVIKSSKFKNEANFNNSIFEKVDLQNIDFYDYVDFSGCTFPDSVNFNFVKTNDKINISNVSIRAPFGKSRIDLTNSDADKFIINFDKFELWFPNAQPKEIISTYEKILIGLSNNKLGNDYKKIDIEFQRYLATRNGSFGIVTDKFKRFFWNYGYSPGLIIYWVFLVFFTCAFLIAYYYDIIQREVYCINSMALDIVHSYDNPSKVRVDLSNESIFSKTLKVVLFTAVIFFGLKINFANIQRNALKKHPYLFIFLLIVYLLGLLSVIYLVNYGLKL